jgi:cell division protein FtsW
MASARPRPVVRHPGELRWETRLLLVVTAILVVFGVAASAGAGMTVRSGLEVGLDAALSQALGAAAGAVVLFAAANLDYRRWQAWAWPLLGITVLLLLIPVLPGTGAIAPRLNGARRWVRFPLIGLFQPSEIARFAVVVWCAMLASKKGQMVREFKRGALPFLVVIGLLSGLILGGRNLSMAVLVAMCGAVVLFAAGARIGHFVLAGLGAILVIVQVIILTGFRSNRVLAFIDILLGADTGPSAVKYQLQQSLIGFGSGGAIGRGFGEGLQKLGYLPYANSDFLFSAIGEEWGFVGVVMVVMLYALFCWLGYRIAKTAADPFGMFLAVGLTSSVGIAAFLHMFVSIGLMPTTGLTLPFMSSGKSSLIIMMLTAGVLLNVGRMRGKPAKAARPPKGVRSSRPSRDDDDA